MKTVNYSRLIFALGGSMVILRIVQMDSSFFRFPIVIVAISILFLQYLRNMQLNSIIF